jgi:hypothetical protein
MSVGTILVHALVALLLAAGVAGSVVPLLPGPPLVLAGVLLYAWLTDFTVIGAGRLAILAGLLALSYPLDYLAGALGVRRFGGSAWAVWGALAGAVVGVFFGIPGIVLGPLAGAIAGELLRGRRLDESVKAGWGALVGLALGGLARLGLTLASVALFLWWAARG